MVGWLLRRCRGGFRLTRVYCGGSGVKSAGPWCYVQKDTCKHQPIADQSGLFYDSCSTVTSNHTLDTGESTHCTA